MEAYSSFAEVYDELMDNVPYKEWCDYVCQILSKHGITDGLLLDLGCGTGTFTEMLAERGYDMIGVDNSEDMLALAMDKRYDSGHDILYLLQDMREFELYGTVRGIVSICDCMNYILTPEDFLKVLKLAWNYLDYDGVFIFDLNTEYKYEMVLADSTIAENREDCSFIWENSYDKTSHLNQYDLTLFVRDEEDSDSYTRFYEQHIQRSYSITDVISLIDQSGLKLEKVYFAGNFEDPTPECERVCFVTTKPHNYIKGQ